MFNERTDIKNPTANFPSAGRTVVIGKSGYTPRWTHVYQCSDEVKAWDGLDTRVTHCVGSRLGVFIPVIIKVLVGISASIIVIISRIIYSPV